MITVVETRRFALDAETLFSEESLAQLVTYLAFSPEAGDVIQGTGGFRKLRWASSGRGKRGGARVIYFYWVGSYVVLTRAYAKNVKIDLTTEEKRALRQVASTLKGEKGNG